MLPSPPNSIYIMHFNLIFIDCYNLEYRSLLHSQVFPSKAVLALVHTLFILRTAFLFHFLPPIIVHWALCTLKKKENMFTLFSHLHSWLLKLLYCSLSHYWDFQVYSPFCFNEFEEHYDEVPSGCNKWKQRTDNELIQEKSFLQTLSSYEFYLTLEVVI